MDCLFNQVMAFKDPPMRKLEVHLVLSVPPNQPEEVTTRAVRALLKRFGRNLRMRSIRLEIKES